MSLWNCDREDLQNSGLSEETIRANHLYTKNRSLIFPYHELDGNRNCYSRRKPHKPRVVDGKPVKYESPANISPRAYFPVESLPAIRDNNGPIFVTEGEKKALKMAQEGLTTIGIGGIYSWKKKSTDELIDDLAAIDWKRRPVYVVFDYDEKAKTRKQCDNARRRLAKALRAVGASQVYNVELPPGPNDGKQGVDDFLVANGIKQFQKLVKQAKPVPICVSTSLRKPAGRTDTANAARLIAQYGDKIRWVGPWNKFLIWDGRRWRIDDELKIHALAKQVTADLWKNLADEIKTGTLNKDTTNAMLAFVQASNNARRITDLVSLARSEPGVPIRLDQLDADPWLLNVENGTLNLKTSQLRKHQQADFITKLAPVTFDPQAKCPTWLKFLDTIFDGDKTLIEFMKRLTGYCLTGVTQEHILPILYGLGSNGKSTLCELLMKLLGSDYAMKAPPDLLMAKRGETHPTERADLFGKRFVACMETEDGRKLAESLVKELTGGDRVRARRMREDFWEFAPTHHVWLSSNHKPVIVGTDHGIWRRIKLIPFNVVIPDAKQDKQLPMKLAAELSGILNWAIEGCLEWQQNGMQEPDIVREATQEYSTEMDDIGEFINGYCECGSGYVAGATTLYQLFVQETGSEITQKAFGQSLARRGFISDRITKGLNKGKMRWRGLRLMRDDDD